MMLVQLTHSVQSPGVKVLADVMRGYSKRKTETKHTPFDGQRGLEVIT